MPRLLGSAFGFFVWAVHLLVVYIAQAVSCQLAAAFFTTAGTGLTALLVGATAAAALAVVADAVRQRRRLATPGEESFLARIAIGQDAIAVLAILWQLIPLFTVPLCR